MKIVIKSLKIVLIIIGISVGLYAIEMAFFPKKTIECNLNSIKSEASEFLDVNYMIRANKYAIGKIRKSNGWYVSKNESKKNEGKFLKKGLSLQIDEEELTIVEDKFMANKLFLVNNTDQNICFLAQDSRLNLKMQAKNILGIWQDIEYIPNSWCGNSYHEICLEKGEFWDFPSLQFKGRHKTKFRYKLKTENSRYIF